MTEPIQRDEASSFAIDVKGGGRTNNRRKSRQTGRASNKRKRKQTEKVDCHQCQRGRLLEILSLMAKEAALRQRRQHSGKRGSAEAKEGKRGTAKAIEAARRQLKCNSHRSTVRQRQSDRSRDRGREQLQNSGNRTLQRALYI
jgi:hypothetical protein